MKLQLEYRQFMDKQPIWWKNFINDVDSRYDFRFTTMSVLRSNTIKQELELQGCTKVYDEDNQQEYLEFEDEAKATWFLMRWT